MKKILAIFLAMMLFANMTVFTAFAEEEGLVVEFVNAENSFLISGLVDSDRDRIPMTLHVSKDGQTLAVAETLAVGKTADGFNSYTMVIPEPSTYAAIFGAIALGFVAYRRRK